MNLKSFMLWRSRCFFCGEELLMLPSIAGIRTANYSIENNYFTVFSKYLNFKFHLETGFIVKRTNDPDLEAYLARRGEVEFNMKCSQCETDGKYYSYYGRFLTTNEKTHMEMGGIIERVVYEGIILTQFPLEGVGTVEVYRLFNIDSADEDTSLVKKIKIDIPYIDLAQTNLDKIKNKIKTYITFS